MVRSLQGPRQPSATPSHQLCAGGHRFFTSSISRCCQHPLQHTWSAKKKRTLKLPFCPGSQLLPMILVLPIDLIGTTLRPVHTPSHHVRAERKQKQRAWQLRIAAEKLLQYPQAARIPWKHFHSTQSWNPSLLRGNKVCKEECGDSVMTCAH